MNILSLIRTYYNGGKVMQLATTKDRQPWICTVHYACDEELKLYWLSVRSRQHSLEVMANPKTATTIVKDTARKQALQIIGEASEVKDDDLERVHELYTKKFGPMDLDVDEMKQRNPDGLAYWVFSPTGIWLWDEVNFPGSPKQYYKPPRHSVVASN